MHGLTPISAAGTVGIAAVGLVVLAIAILTWIRDRAGRSNPNTSLRSHEASVRTRVLRAAMFAFCTILAFETAKQALHPNITVWTSHIVTILFATLVSAVVSLVVLRKEERLRFELAVREKRYRSLFEGSVAGVFRTALDGRILDCNPALCRILDYSREELLTRSVRDFYFYPADRSAFIARLQSDNQVTNFEVRLRRKDGSAAWVLQSATLVASEEGSEPVVEGIMTDISDRKKIEHVLQEAERKYRGIFDDAIVGMFQSAPNGRFLNVNRAMARMFGFTSPEKMVASVTDISRQLFVEPKRYDEFAQVMDTLGSMLSLECEVYRKDGNRIWIACSGRAVRENRVVVRYEGMAEDITIRKSAEKSLVLLRMLMDQSHDGIEVVDPKTLAFIDFNQKICQDSGYSREELLSRTIYDINPTIEPEAVAALEERLKQTGSEILETVHKHKDGSTFPVEVSIKRVELDRAYYFCVVRDVADRQRLQQSQKLESIGQLAAGIAHEINTPTQYIGDNVRFLGDAFRDLRSLLANYERLLAAAKDNALSGETVQAIAAAVEHVDAGYLLDEIPRAVEQSLEGVNRVSKLVGAMKEFSHPGTKEKIALDLNHAIENTITVARNEWKYVADMETDYDASLPTISCLPGEFNQVILNLIVNAAHAIADVVGKGGSEKGRIKVKTRNCAEWVEIRIQDTGTGIPEKVRAQIFDPFFTTKGIGKGTGQGLAIARSVIVDKHNGSIDFETEEGKGTTFIVRLPKDGKALAATAGS